jgi:hypothetical protein
MNYNRKGITKSFSKSSNGKDFDLDASLKRMVHIITHLQKRVDEFGQSMTTTFKQKAKEFSKHSGE